MPDYRDEINTSAPSSQLSPKADFHPAPTSLSSSQLPPETQHLFEQLVQESLADLTQRRQTLTREVAQLEQERDRLQAEMQSHFAGVSKDLSVQVQGFKDYLVGSLQDLATAAEQLSIQVPDSLNQPRHSDSPSRSMPSRSPQAGVGQSQDNRETSRPGHENQRQRRSPQPLNLQPAPKTKQRSDGTTPPRQDHPSRPSPSVSSAQASSGIRPPVVDPSPIRSTPSTGDISGVAHQMFGENAKQIRQILDQYRQSPNYYGTPWQLRRTFEPIHADRVSQWFFEQGGRGSLKTLGSRLQNVLVAAAIISVLRVMYGDRLHSLILSDSPERLGEWRRGLQDCLGISRSDFGGQQGVALFEAPEALTQRTERLIQQGRLPLILIDHSTDTVHLSLLQYPLWLAFAPDLNAMPLY
ncbi:MAG: DUF3086 domain-containing protein [Leptolyngbyaceae cyanobacterium]